MAERDGTELRSMSTVDHALLRRQEDAAFPIDDESFKRLTEPELTKRVLYLYSLLVDQGVDPNVLSLKMLTRGALLAQRRDFLLDPEEPRPEKLSKSDVPLLQYCHSRGRVIDACSVNQNLDLLTLEEKTLTWVEFDAISQEEAGKLKCLPRNMWIILLTCAVGAAVQGWSQESIIGANLHWPCDRNFNIGNLTENGACKPSPGLAAQFGLINAIPYFAASLLGPLVSDPIADVYGRRTALVIAATCSLVAPIGGAYCLELWQLFGCRLVQGVGIGAKSSIIPVVESEISPPTMRGTLLVSWQTFVAVGLFAGACANLIFAGDWPAQIAIASIPALVFLFFCLVMPETPHWRVKKHDFGGAFRTLTRIRKTELQAARDIYVLFEETIRSPPKDVVIRNNPKAPIHISITRRRSFFFQKFIGLFRERRNRNAVIASWLVMASQQASGINIFAFQSTTPLQTAENGERDTLGLNVGFAATNAVASAFAYFIINRTGRRRLLLGSLILMCPFLIGLGFALKPSPKGADPYPAQTSSPKGAITLLIIYTMIYSVGAGVIPFMYSSEVFPIQYRETGMASACFVNFGLAGIIPMVVSIFLSPDQSNLNAYPIMFGTMAALDGLAAVLVFFFMRSPTGPTSLEDMDAYFEPPLLRYPLYQGYRVKHWILKQQGRLFRKQGPGQVGEGQGPLLSFLAWNEANSPHTSTLNYNPDMSNGRVSR